MEREKKRIPPALRYPLFMLGLIVLVIGELIAVAVNAGLDAEVTVAVVGYLFLVLAVALR